MTSKDPREIDCEIARELGWKDVRIWPAYGVVIGNNPRGHRVDVPDYSTDLNAVWEAAREAAVLWMCAPSLQKSWLAKETARQAATRMANTLLFFLRETRRVGDEQKKGTP